MLWMSTGILIEIDWVSIELTSGRINHKARKQENTYIVCFGIPHWRICTNWCFWWKNLKREIGSSAGYTLRVSKHFDTTNQKNRILANNETKGFDQNSKTECDSKDDGQTMTKLAVTLEFHLLKINLSKRTASDMFACTLEFVFGEHFSDTITFCLCSSLETTSKPVYYSFISVELTCRNAHTLFGKQLGTQMFGYA